MGPGISSFRQRDGFVDHSVEAFGSCGEVTAAYIGTDAADDFAGACGLGNYMVERRTQLLLPRIGNKAAASGGVVIDGGERLVDFMHQGADHLAHFVQPLRVREFRL